MVAKPGIEISESRWRRGIAHFGMRKGRQALWAASWALSPGGSGGYSGLFVRGILAGARPITALVQFVDLARFASQSPRHQSRIQAMLLHTEE